MIFPWHTVQWKQLYQAKLQHRLPHALLLSGHSGLGKAQFADCFTRVLLCQAPSKDHNETYQGYCNDCHACRLVANRTHPNLLWITPEKAGHAIKVDQIRELYDFAQQSSLQGDYRVIVIHPACAMNQHAANALLKTLEEPSQGVILILISNQSSPLLPTIVSRCQRILFLQPDRALALDWLKQELFSRHQENTIDADLLLKLANGAPLMALDYIENGFLTRRKDLLHALSALHQKEGDPFQFAAKFEDIDLIRVIDMILTWMIDLMRLKVAGDQDQIINQDFLKELIALNEQTKVQENMQFIRYLQELRGEIVTGINLNKLLAIESIFIRLPGRVD